MNERTIELYKDALRFAYDNVKPSDPAHVINTLAVGKLAELIVQECVDIAWPNINGFVIAKKIKEHFGVAA